eukprot:3354132-Pyramimonas_sp.AAC.1
MSTSRPHWLDQDACQRLRDTSVCSHQVQRWWMFIMFICWCNRTPSDNTLVRRYRKDTLNRGFMKPDHVLPSHLGSRRTTSVPSKRAP